MTKMDYFRAMQRLCADNADILEFLEHEIKKLEQKEQKLQNHPNRKTIKNNSIKEEIEIILDNATTPLTATDICKYLSTKTTLQRVSALLIQMKNDGEVERLVERRVCYFAIPKRFHSATENLSKKPLTKRIFGNII